MAEISNCAETLHDRGYRVTPQRMVIYRILEDSSTHLTPSQVYQRAHQALPGLTEATVYRTLNFLTKQGLIQAAHIGSGQFVYEASGNAHHHLICRVCGQSYEIEHTLMVELYDLFKAHSGYIIDSVHTTFFGLCPNCQIASPVVITDLEEECC